MIKESGLYLMIGVMSLSLLRKNKKEKTNGLPGH